MTAVATTRVKGTKEANEILAAHDFEVADTLQDACKKATEMAKGMPMAKTT